MLSKYKVISEPEISDGYSIPKTECIADINLKYLVDQRWNVLKYALDILLEKNPSATRAFMWIE